MIAGKVRINLTTQHLRILADYDALCRLAAAAAKGLDGKEGLAETQRFLEAVIDPRDRERWRRTQARLTDQARNNTIAAMIAVINEKACYSDDVELAEWGWWLRDAIEDFRQGNPAAFWELAIGNVTRHADA